MTVLAVDPAQYADAATQMSRVADTTGGSIRGLAAALGSSGGMGGSDNAGTEWSHSYDESARSAMEAAAGLVNGTGQVAVLLHATGQNHADADTSSTVGGRGGRFPAAPRAARISTPRLPQAGGGSGGGPPGWSLVAGLVGYAWPNGHQDRLHAAQAAWNSAAAELTNGTSVAGSAASKVSVQRSPEVAQASAACTAVSTHAGELARVFQRIGSSCAEYATHLDDAHHEILATLKELMIETAAIEAAGAAFAIFTVGLDEVAAQAAVATRIATAAAKIRRVIEALVDGARAVAASVRGFAARAVEIASKMKPFEEAVVKRAGTQAVNDIGETGAATADNLAGSIRNVNPGGGQTNCVNCVVTTDRMLDGEKVSAALGEPRPVTDLQDYFGAKFKPMSGQGQIESIMDKAGDGARGVVFGYRGPDQVGHVFNVVNQRGIVRFLDGQSGSVGTFGNQGYIQSYLMRYR
ncbi:toxin glutamine deamidase domain-containing protein [Gordonia hankookensis]|uniref:Tox-PL domain-containing protein n=1 Tax=Gordonia hankookensis TaxID=589403 RepID=A0ABR7WCU0_9ACTN|nr:toxin glutamine deamidase domain-containing protein [Gordonia hankookensis]MBD1320615.1 hypothetical protein [Gordonia hankookensis]